MLQLYSTHVHQGPANAKWVTELLYAVIPIFKFNIKFVFAR